MRVNLPINFSQFDPAYASQILGLNTDPKFNFYNYACLVCCLSDVAKLFGHDETPLTLNAKLIELSQKTNSQSGYAANSAFYIPGSLPQLFADIQEKAVATPEALTDEQMAEIKSALDNHNPVVLGIDYNPRTLLPDYHFVVAIDYDPTDENNFTIADPLGGRNHSLKDYLAATKPSARATIERYFIFTGPAVSEAVTTPSGESQVLTPPSQLNALPDNYGEIIKKSTGFDDLVKQYLPGVKPEDATAEQVITAIEAAFEHSYHEGMAAAPKTTEAMGQIVANSASDEKWSQLIAYLKETTKLEKDPNDAVFEDVKRVISGIKSRQTDLDNQRLEAVKLVEEKAVTITNLETEIGSMKREALRKDKIHKAELNSVKQNVPSFEALKREYGGVIAELEGQVREHMGEAARLRISIAREKVETDIKTAEVALANGSLKVDFSNPIKLVLTALKRYVTLSW
jgi:hypothetical protein